ncbi:exo-alpha-sialidase [Phycisphaerales bacterium AB-hyl4]|uniref:Exo-alpha-sialidase n=1 Tax=Natronomicrosphaera hydrolytica TaxID=3242702 RepID=A0ABV4U5K9_9BACT
MNNIALATSYPVQVIHNFGEGHFGSAREPVLRRMQDGSLLCFHYTGGPWEPHDENCIVRTISLDDGKTWSQPEVIFNHPRRATWGPELFAEDGKVMAFVHTFNTDRWYGEMKTFLAISSDSGRTFTEPSMMPGPSGNVVMRRTIVLSNGDWLTPCYWQEHLSGFTNEFTREGFSQGGEWRFRVGVVRANNQDWKTANVVGRLENEHCDLWEPNAVEIAPGHIVMFMRASGTGVLYRAESLDYGRSWSEAVPTDIPNADTKITLLKIRNKTILLNNPTSRGRSRIELWVSDDGCENWATRIEVARLKTQGRAGVNEHYIPAMVCYPDGFVDEAQESIYVAFEDGACHYMAKIPLADFR